MSIYLEVAIVVAKDAGESIFTGLKPRVNESVTSPKGSTAGIDMALARPPLSR